MRLWRWNPVVNRRFMCVSLTYIEPERDFMQCFHYSVFLTDILCMRLDVTSCRCSKRCNFGAFRFSLPATCYLENWALGSAEVTEMDQCPDTSLCLWEPTHPPSCPDLLFVRDSCSELLTTVGSSWPVRLWFISYREQANCRDGWDPHIVVLLSVPIGSGDTWDKTNVFFRLIPFRVAMWLHAKRTKRKEHPPSFV